MKRSYLLMMVALIMFASCQNQEKTAQRNIKEFLIEETGEEYQLQMDKFSKLYIISPKVEENIPKPDPHNSEELYAHMKLFSSRFMLTLHGCSPESFKWIVENDRKFNEFNTGGKEYAMLCFFKAKDKYMNEEKVSLCAVLDSVYNVSRLYEVKNVDEILNMMKNNK